MQLRRIVLGEFVDDLDIGTYIADALGLPEAEEESDDESVSEKTGASRLGPSNLFSSLGPSMLLFIIIFLVLILLVLLALYCRKRCSLSEKAKICIEKIKRKIFWNPIIRSTMLGAIKLNMGAMMIFRVGWPDD